MITYKQGDLLTSGCDLICHQVNLNGFMGGGIALQIATKYPKCEQAYSMICEKVKNLGGQVFFFTSQNPKIANCFSQNEDFTTNYDWLKKCAKEIYNTSKMLNYKTIGIPKNYGCGIARGNWSIVEKIFKDIFEKSDELELQIWEYKE